MNYWQQFANSGNIKDYLSYLGSVDKIPGIESAEGILSVRSTNGDVGEYSNLSVQQVHYFSDGVDRRIGS